MNNIPDENISPSYFWQCITLSDDCPFFVTADPNLYYFGVGLITMYTLFLLTVLADLNFYGTVDNLQERIGLCINFVKKKLRNIDVDQRRLLSIQERTEKQTRRNIECTKIVTALRGALQSDDPRQMEALTGHTEENFEIMQDTD